MTPEDITDAMLAYKFKSLREEILEAMLGNGISPEQIGPYLGKIEGIITEAIDRHRPKILAQVMLTECLGGTPIAKS